MEDWPPRRYGWVAHHTDGEVLREVYDRPPLTPWEQLDLDQLASLALVDLWPTGEGVVLSLDCEEGTFVVRGRRLAIAVGEVTITGRDGAYQNVLQWKEAHSDYRLGQGSTTVLDAHVIGYRRTLPEFDSRVLLRLDVATRRVEIDLQLRPKQPELDSTDVGVSLDGERVADGAAFRELTSPPGVG